MHVWEKRQEWYKAYKLLYQYGILLKKRGINKKKKCLMLKRIKLFSKATDDGVL
jgi:hypothetical protein